MVDEQNDNGEHNHNKQNDHEKNRDDQNHNDEQSSNNEHDNDNNWADNIDTSVCPLDTCHDKVPDPCSLTLEKLFRHLADEIEKVGENASGVNWKKFEICNRIKNEFSIQPLMQLAHTQGWPRMIKNWEPVVSRVLSFKSQLLDMMNKHTLHNSIIWGKLIVFLKDKNSSLDELIQMNLKMRSLQQDARKLSRPG